MEGTDYAIKFVRANTMMRKAAEKEVEVYRKLQRTAAAGSKKDQEACQYLMFLSQPESFVHKGHMCMVFTLQKCDLRTALQKYGQGRGLPMQTVVKYSRQLFTDLRVLRQWGVIHGDLKPDNVLLSMAKTEIKVCDFGSAFEVADQIKTAYMQPRYYRAPEVIVGHPYDTQVDLWSVAVTLFELASGKILFTGRSNNAMLRQMLEVCGPYSRKLSTTGAFSAKHFSSDGDFIFKDPSTIIGQEVMPMKRFSQPGRHISSMLDKVLKEPPPNSDPKTQEKLLPKLADLVSKCLVWDAEERVIPETALEHAFFKKEK
jgi:serine/threonine-protein kinase PRP4